MIEVYLILIISGQALWGIPVPYPDLGQCEAAGRAFDDGRSLRHLCLPAPIVTGSTVNRLPKRDMYPLLNCFAAEANAGPPGTQICESGRK